ncbi:hypothetical protein PDJ82_00205 [Bacillus cereus group sp. TH43LC]|uniref:hypothetical protein n=1 Tax=Bacillus cereus group TaxID=86661 RepID=UPI00053556EC|nr:MULTISPECIES: hypothetical protein [Bacillus cereus group]ALL20641.1 hypothetical protein BTXL6_03895 [Bacillus thuringiensis]KXY01641.1 hypothetical protein AT271_15285 [Bacillus cereus]MBE7145090.1 hypothetical protein [Bacillus paranthracis]MCC2437802.1 hypothetical protein [Bacillus paranthracis]MDA1500029.1 hypothetical protein [Bacillus cereus group sp. TH43LC]
MKHNINLWSFIFSFICIGLFLLYLEIGSIASSETKLFIMNSLPIHPLFFVLIFSIGTFFAGIIGFSKVDNWIAMLRSIVTVLLTLLLSVFLTLTLIVGYALS